eukprot:TRINITY_DN55619_c0_g1_i1.p1 TRINITY_DN55619_c0_g1~~TRINITY_DN55619_c0_g1_i1.p1  ORF type:complete len:699 (+),score=235.11 TRINITY_DN55619_c0_g1_i1:85-2097(+)
MARTYGGEPALAEFDPEGQRCAVIFQNRARIYETATARHVTTLTPPDHLRNAVSCCCWGSLPKQDGAAEGQPLLALGCLSGRVFAWNIALDKLFCEATVPGAVTGVCFDAEGTLYAASDQHMAVVPDGNSAAKVTAQLPRDNTSLDVAPGGRWIAVGAKRQCLLRYERGAEKGERMCVWAGHTHSANIIRFGSLPPGSDTGECPPCVVSHSHHDPFISIWKCPRGAAELSACGGGKGVPIPPAATLQVAAPARQISTQGDAVAAVTKKGNVLVWFFDLAASGVSKPVPDATVHGLRPDKVLGAALCTGARPAEVQIAYGSLAAPGFCRVRVRQEDGVPLFRARVPGTVKRDIEAGAGLLPAGQMQLTGAKRPRPDDKVRQAKVRPSEAVDLGPLAGLGGEQATIGFKQQQVLARKRRRQEAEERVRVSHALQQALARVDRPQINQLLADALSRPGLVDSSVQGLDRQGALQLLRECVRRLHDKSTRATDLLPWIRAVLAHHPQHLLSVPDLEGMLRPLQSVVDDHMRSLQTLCHLQGRLEMAVARASVLRRRSAQGPSGALPTLTEAAARRAARCAPVGDGDDAEEEEEEEVEEDEELEATVRGAERGGAAADADFSSEEAPGREGGDGASEDDASDAREGSGGEGDGEEEDEEFEEVQDDDVSLHSGGD